MTGAESAYYGRIPVEMTSNLNAFMQTKRAPGALLVKPIPIDAKNGLSLIAVDNHTVRIPFHIRLAASRPAAQNMFRFASTSTNP